MVAAMPWRRSSWRLSSLMVTWAQAAVVGRRGEMGQMGALPRQVVVVQHGRPPGAHLGHQGGGRRVEGERAQVLDDDQVGGRQRVGELAPGRWRGGVDGQALEPGVDRARRRPP